MAGFSKFPIPIWVCAVHIRLFIYAISVTLSLIYKKQWLSSDGCSGRLVRSATPARDGKTRPNPQTNPKREALAWRSGAPTGTRENTAVEPVRDTVGAVNAGLCRGKTRCRNHAGLSTGPRTEEGRQRSWAARDAGFARWTAESGRHAVNRAQGALKRALRALPESGGRSACRTRCGSLPTRPAQ